MAHRRRIAEQVERQNEILTRVDQVLPGACRSFREAMRCRWSTCRGAGGQLPERPRPRWMPSSQRESGVPRRLARVASEHLITAGPVVFLHEHDLFTPWYSPARFQACVALADDSPVPADAWTLPACSAATTVHRGPWDGLRASWAALVAWVGRAGFDACPPVRVTYEIGPGGPQDPAGFVTHTALPIKRPRTSPDAHEEPGT